MKLNIPQRITVAVGTLFFLWVLHRPVWILSQFRDTVVERRFFVSVFSPPKSDLFYFHVDYYYTGMVLVGILILTIAATLILSPRR